MSAVLTLLSTTVLLQGSGGAPARVDSAATDSTLARPLLLRLPVDDPRDALSLTPGVAQRGNGMGIGSGSNLSFRLGIAGGASVYIDGAPARFLITGGQGIGLAADALESVVVTTGLPDLAVDDGRGGVVFYVTRTGGPRLEGHLLAHTDAPFGDGSSVGYNRFAGSAGGSFSTRLSWFASGELVGQRSAYRGLGAADQPAFVWGAPDTTVGSVTLPTFRQSIDLRRPLDWLTQRRAVAKVVYWYGAGASVALTALASDLQQRFFPGQDIGDPALFSGARAWSRLAVLNWTQPLASGRLALHTTLSLGSDHQDAGLLTPPSEAASRDPALGIVWSALQFTGRDSIPFPLTDRIVRHIRSNAGLRVPLLNRNDLRNVQPYRLNPFGLVSGWPTGGSDGTLSGLTEQRADVRIWASQTLAMHQMRLGVDYGRATQTVYQSPLLTQLDMDAWIARPHHIGGFVADRFALGRLTFDLGVRFDRSTPGGDLPRTPGRIFTNPAWAVNAATDDTAYANSIARVFTPAPSHSAISPRAHVEYAATAHSMIWLDVGQVVQLETSSEIFGRSNSDLSFTNVAALFGDDAGLLRSTIAELGARHTVAGSLAVEASGYVERRGVYAGRIKPFDDPANPGSPFNLEVVTPLDSANLWGFNAALGWRPSTSTRARAVYAYTRSGGMGFQTVAAMTILQSPVSGDDHSTLGSILRDVSAVFLVRGASGLPYFPTASITTTGFIPFGPGQIPLRRLPWSKNLDARFSKALQLRGIRGTLYADVRNLVNLHSVLGAYVRTGSQTDTIYQALVLGPEYVNLHLEAQSNGRLLANNAVDLRPDCTTWTNGNGPVVNCEALRGVEQRFGNGDGVYDLAEQTRTLNAYFNSLIGAWRFYEPGRTLRIGVEVAF